MTHASSLSPGETYTEIVRRAWKNLAKSLLAGVLSGGKRSVNSDSYGTVEIMAKKPSLYPPPFVPCNALTSGKFPAV